MQVCVGLGSNLRQPLQQVRKAQESVANLKLVAFKRCSSYYQSQPLGAKEQPPYVNAVMLIETDLEAYILLEQLQAIEDQMGRVRQDERWASRVIDIDIVLYGNEVIQTDRLTVPHYDMHNREFVLIPMMEINPDWALPSGETVQQLVERLPAYDMERVAS